jgi:hypothetical protein
MIGLVLAVPFLLAGCLLVVGFLIRWHSYREYLKRRAELILVSQRYQADLARAMRKRPPSGLIPLTDKEERELVARHMRGTRWPH